MLIWEQLWKGLTLYCGPFCFLAGTAKLQPSCITVSSWRSHLLAMNPEIISLVTKTSCVPITNPLQNPRYIALTLWWLFFPLLWVLIFCSVVIQPLEQVGKYTTEQGIPFPKIRMTEEDKKTLKECYVFEDAENPRAPIVLFFPLVNDTYKNYKAPGKLSAVSDFTKNASWPACPVHFTSAGSVSYPPSVFNKITLYVNTAQLL